MPLRKALSVACKMFGTIGSGSAAGRHRRPFQVLDDMHRAGDVTLLAGVRLPTEKQLAAVLARFRSLLDESR